MKGLYVYGALCMVFSFVVGMHGSDSFAMAFAVISCAMAALSEALAEILSQVSSRASAFVATQGAIALLSCVMTAIAVVRSLVLLVGG